MFRDIKKRGSYTSFIYEGTDAPKLCKILMNDIVTLAVHTMTVRENTSPVQDEHIAHRIGLCPTVSGEKGTLIVSGTNETDEDGNKIIREVTTDDIEGITFKGTHPLFQLRGKKNKFVATFETKEGKGALKYRNVSQIRYLKNSDKKSYTFVFINTGPYSDEELIKRGIDLLSS